MKYELERNGSNRKVIRLLGDVHIGTIGEYDVVSTGNTEQALIYNLFMELKWLAKEIDRLEPFHKAYLDIKERLSDVLASPN